MHICVRESPLLREFQTFLAVCRWGTFTAAAQRLGMTQSAVSDHIQRLEEFTGVQLFHRTGRSATLNAAGEALRPLAEEALQITDRMRTGHGAGQLRGSLRVGAITSVHNSLMARALVAFRRAHPAVTIRLIRREGAMAGDVEREEFDLAASVLPNLAAVRTIRWIPLFRKPFALIAPAATRARDWREAMAMHTFMGYDLSWSTGVQIDDFLTRMGVAIRDTLWVDYLDTMITLVAGSVGVGVAIIPRTPLGEAAGLVREFEFGADTFYREVGLVRRARPPNGGAIADAFIDTLLDEVKREPFAEAIGA
jgi:DNA-binding transcriptional LysR family regulator